LDSLEHFVSYPDVVGVNALLKSLGVDTIHIHQAMGQESLSKGLALSGDFRIIVTIHDYYFLTPNWTFSKSHSEFHEFPKDLSELDFINREYDSGVTSTWGSAREWISMLDNVDLIIYPSQSAFNDFSGFVNNSNHVIALHPEFPYPELYPDRNSDNNADIETFTRVGVFGDLGPHKGTELLKQIIGESPTNITFVGFGRANPDVIELFDEWCGTYEQNEIVRLLHVNSVDVLLLPMQIHETYSYSLSEALRSGLRIVASNIPIFNERAGHRRKVSLVNLDDDPKAWINALLFQQKIDPLSSVNNRDEFKSRDFYKSEYWKHI
jgi:glycosyltransferase involved in cell wall biosynthesis